ncbi:histone acetyltransferases subunit 3-domain-containing protein [Pyronema omphalodes]|nr:histone acetyltransferases subunit 3-domain-containing protein [Pyronema omphalodes]
MSTPSAKGKGKSRGMSSQSRRSHSRNTTPASGSTYGDTLPSDYPSSSIGKIDYEDVFERLDLANNPGIPSSASLHTLKQELTSLKEAAYTRSAAAEKSMRAFMGKAKDREESQISRDKKVLEDAERKEKIKLKKRKAEPEHKRPLAVGAHQATGQGPTNDTKVIKKKKKSPNPKQSSPEDSDAEHQPVQSSHNVFFEPLDDDPAVYEIPAVTPANTYAERAAAYAVARFPEDDLSTLIPGDPPDGDFCKSVPSNQIPIHTFSAYIEPYFRPFTAEEDLTFLRERGDRVQPYIIPKLGKHYSEVWTEEDGPAVGNLASPAPPTNSSSNKFANHARGSPADLEEPGEADNVSCGPLLSRLLAAYMPEDPVSDDEPMPDAGATPAPAKTYATSLIHSGEVNWKIPTGKTDYHTMDERIRQEMVYVGLLNPNEDLDFDNREDDEVSVRLRLLQKQLREQAVVNAARKARIAEQLKEQLAYQEYVMVLEDLDKQVEQAFAKRSRNMKATKKKKNIPIGAGVARAHVGLGQQTRDLLERRNRWVKTIEPVFSERNPADLPKGEAGLFDGFESGRVVEEVEV